jgi:hypothetical protein
MPFVPSCAHCAHSIARSNSTSSAPWPLAELRCLLVGVERKPARDVAHLLRGPLRRLAHEAPQRGVRPPQAVRADRPDRLDAELDETDVRLLGRLDEQPTPDVVPVVLASRLRREHQVGGVRVLRLVAVERQLVPQRRAEPNDPYPASVFDSRTASVPRAMSMSAQRRLSTSSTRAAARNRYAPSSRQPPPRVTVGRHSSPRVA